MSVRIEYDLGSVSPQEAAGLIAMLQHIAGKQTHSKVEVRHITSVPEAFDTHLPEASGAETEVNAKRGRPVKKTEAAEAPAVPTAVPEPASTPEPNADSPSSPATAQAASKTYTRDELHTELQKVIDAKGMPACQELLQDFKCARLTDVMALPPEKQAEFVGRCNA